MFFTVLTIAAFRPQALSAGSGLEILCFVVPLCTFCDAVPVRPWPSPPFAAALGRVHCDDVRPISAVFGRNAGGPMVRQSMWPALVRLTDAMCQNVRMGHGRRRWGGAFRGHRDEVSADAVFSVGPQDGQRSQRKSVRVMGGYHTPGGRAHRASSGGAPPGAGGLREGDAMCRARRPPPAPPPPRAHQDTTARDLIPKCPFISGQEYQIPPSPQTCNGRGSAGTSRPHSERDRCTRRAQRH